VNWASGIVLYVIIWMVALFAVLPFGTRPNPEPDAKTGWRGTPERPRLGLKLLATTLIALVIWGAISAVIEKGWISFRSGWLALPDR
jgi:predicted secreted protein